MSDGLELNGRRPLVTGGTQGIGEAVVARLFPIASTYKEGNHAMKAGDAKALHKVPPNTPACLLRVATILTLGAFASGH